YLTVLGLFALAIGGLIRPTAGGLTPVIGMVLVIFPLGAPLPGDWGAHAPAYPPAGGGGRLPPGQGAGGHALSGRAGVGVVCGAAALLLAAATFLLQKRDA